MEKKKVFSELKKWGQKRAFFQFLELKKLYLEIVFFFFDFYEKNIEIL